MSNTEGTPKNLKEAIRQGFDRYMKNDEQNGREAALTSIQESVMEFLNNRVGAAQMSLETDILKLDASYEGRGKSISNSDFKRTFDVLDKFFKDVKI